MQVLVFNAGSSSVKYELFDMSVEQSVLTGSVDRIGEAGSSAPDHEAAFGHIRIELGDWGLRDDDVVAVGHRVVHGGDDFSEPVVIDSHVLQQIDELSSLAPLHNPPNLAGIRAALAQFPAVPHVAVFDTAFHATMPDRAREYAIPAGLREDHGVRRYGFHGTSYQFVARRAASMLGKPVNAVNLIAMHLGNGASICAIENGCSVDTSMGFTPLEGLVMGTRAGDIDPSVVFHLVREAGLSVDEIDDILNRKSGLKGLCGDSDMRAITTRFAQGDAAASKAVEQFCYRIRKYLGAYFAVLGHVDAIVFTAGIGENNPGIRSRICADLGFLGVHIDDARNADPGPGDAFISGDEASMQLLVVRTDEELEIARQAYAMRSLT